VSYAARAARGTALLGATVAALGALSPWLTYVGPHPPGEMAPFGWVDVALAALVAVGLGYASLLAPGERAPRTVLVRTGVASLLLVLALFDALFAVLRDPGSDVGIPVTAAEFTASGLAHGGGWLVLFAAAGIAALAVTGWDARRASFVVIGGVAIWAVALPLFVPGVGLETHASPSVPPSVDTGLRRGPSLAIGGGALAVLGGLGGVITAAGSRRPASETAVLSGVALVAVGVLLPWSVTRAPHRIWHSLPEWGALFLLVLCPYAALVLAEGISKRLGIGAVLLAAGVLAALLAELLTGNAVRVAGDAALLDLAVPGRVMPVAYFLLAGGSGLLSYAGWTAARTSG